jgi:hypothetical protein
MFQLKIEMAYAVVASVTETNAASVTETNEVANASVSLLTITQYARRECLANLSMLIHQQLYKNIVEWVIVEGTPDKADAIKNAELISKMKSDIPIHFIPWSAGQALSDLRNKGNAACKGDIIVCMDDDDYYPPTRVSHAVHRLQQSTALIAGCSKAYIYFYQTGQFFQFKSFGKGHSTNNCLAYKRAYLANHQHLSGLAKGEESSFTNEFTEEMEQLDPMKTIVISGHGTNTVDKSLVSPAMLIDLNTPALIVEYIPLPILLKMEKIFCSI